MIIFKKTSLKYCNLSWLMKNSKFFFIYIIHSPQRIFYQSWIKNQTLSYQRFSQQCVDDIIIGVEGEGPDFFPDFSRIDDRHRTSIALCRNSRLESVLPRFVRTEKQSKIGHFAYDFFLFSKLPIFYWD